MSGHVQTDLQRQLYIEGAEFTHKPRLNKQHQRRVFNRLCHVGQCFRRDLVNHWLNFYKFVEFFSLENLLNSHHLPPHPVFIAFAGETTKKESLIYCLFLYL